MIAVFPVVVEVKAIGVLYVKSGERIACEEW